MNLLHLKYAVEIADTGSMTKAAESLYTAQPNLSRALRELEGTLGIDIFRRTPKGLFPTAEGEEFLGYARKILAQVDEVEAMYTKDKKAIRRFSISVPRASYIACAFTEFMRKLDRSTDMEVFYKETNSSRAITNITDSDYSLGILRYQSAYDRHFRELLDEKGLISELIWEFRYVLIMPRSHPLASKETICLSDLTPYTEIAHADPYVPSMPLSIVRKNEHLDDVSRHIYVFERASQMDLLSELPDAFMWVSPVPQKLLERYDLIERECKDNEKTYRDVLIRKKEYRLTDIDTAFIDELTQFKRAGIKDTKTGEP